MGRILGNQIAKTLLAGMTLALVGTAASAATHHQYGANTVARITITVPAEQRAGIRVAGWYDRFERRLRRRIRRELRRERRWKRRRARRLERRQRRIERLEERLARLKRQNAAASRRPATTTNIDPVEPTNTRRNRNRDNRADRSGNRNRGNRADRSGNRNRGNRANRSANGSNRQGRRNRRRQQ